MSKRDPLSVDSAKEFVEMVDIHLKKDGLKIGKYIGDGILIMLAWIMVTFYLLIFCPAMLFMWIVIGIGDSDGN